MHSSADNRSVRGSQQAAAAAVPALEGGKEGEEPPLAGEPASLL